MEKTLSPIFINILPYLLQVEVTIMLYLCIFFLVEFLLQVKSSSNGGIYYCDFPATANINGGFGEPSDDWYNYAASVRCVENSNPLKTWIFKPGDSYDSLDKGICNILHTKTIPIYKKRVNQTMCPYRVTCHNHKIVAYIPLMWALENLGVRQEGLWLEFGVATGFSLNITSLHKQKKDPVTVFGFDSFMGLPESWTTVWNKYPAGYFSQGGN